MSDEHTSLKLALLSPRLYSTSTVPTWETCGSIIIMLLLSTFTFSRPTFPALV